MQFRALFVAFRLKRFALRALFFQRRFRALTKRVQFFLALARIRFFVFQMRQFFFEPAQRFFIYAHVVLRFFRFGGKRNFALRKHRQFVQGALILRPQRVHRRFRFFFALFAFRNGGFQLFEVFLLLDDVFAALFYLALAREHAGAALLLTAAARHRAAGAYDIAVQRYDFKHIAVFFGNRRSVVHRIANQRVAQQVGYHVIIIIVVPNQFRGKPYRALFVYGALRFAAVRARLHAAYGQECYHAAARAFQIFD